VTEVETRELAVEILSGIAPEADFSSLRDQEELREALDLDSMDFLNFITALHERTGVDIPEPDYGQLSTLRGVIAYLRR
jgi:acyl carrier protein